MFFVDRGIRVFLIINYILILTDRYVDVYVYVDVYAEYVVGSVEINKQC